MKNSYYYCPNCKINLVNKSQINILECTSCNAKFNTSNGYHVFDESEMVCKTDYKLNSEILELENIELSERLRRWILPNLDSVAGKKILVVGCGGGSDVEELNKLGSNTWGMDFSYRTSFWNKKNYNKNQLFVSSTDFIPFPDAFFDVVLCLGVIEHVHENLFYSKNFDLLYLKRLEFLNSIYKIMKPGGELILSSPNRNFLIDFQHGNYGKKIFDKTPIGLHSPFIKFLESYHSIEHYFHEIGKVKVEPMNLTNFFGFSILKKKSYLSSIFKKTFIFYVKQLDNSMLCIRKSFMNPYLIVKITKVIY